MKGNKRKDGRRGERKGESRLQEKNMKGSKMRKEKKREGEKKRRRKRKKTNVEGGERKGWKIERGGEGRKG